ncbi:type II secretion system protein [Aeromicrobium sp. SMF47]|uniref:Type II secretion system protein n=1 Tax=Aeromicrobium yanjiei TaxID=2662028 RepID=A0A5Q2MIP8_9ACTN|nr:type II secretion system F family protein [Aeromicrobium yanjiei]MRJ75361.1 type II secretion system protein [Aeromicrobium yanjiei]QGG40185.1 type II secretion system protein [Aeromicrobium yanjiei]
MRLAAAVSVVAAMLLWRPPGRWLLRHRLGRRAVEVSRHRVAAAGVAVVVLSLAGQVRGPRLVLAGTVVGIGVFAVRLLGASRRHELVRRRRAEVAEVLGLLAAELRAGLLPVRTLSGLAADFDFLAPAARAADLGADVPAALREASAATGREALLEVAAAWHVAERSGAPLAMVLGRLEDAVRDRREVEREVQAGAGPARATGRLMAVLPVVGLGLGSGMGGDPVAVLTTTWVGVGCLAAGCALACLGVAWVERIASAAEMPP